MGLSMYEAIMLKKTRIVMSILKKGGILGKKFSVSAYVPSGGEGIIARSWNNEAKNPGPVIGTEGADLRKLLKGLELGQ